MITLVRYDGFQDDHRFCTEFIRDSMSLTQEEVDTLAHLSRICLTPEEKVRIQAEINRFFSVVEQILTVDTDFIQPLAHPLQMTAQTTQRCRADDVVDHHTNLDRAAYQQAAPLSDAGYYLIPKVVE